MGHISPMHRHLCWPQQNDREALVGVASWKKARTKFTQVQRHHPSMQSVSKDTQPRKPSWKTMKKMWQTPLGQVKHTRHTTQAIQPWESSREWQTTETTKTRKAKIRPKMQPFFETSKSPKWTTEVYKTVSGKQMPICFLWIKNCELQVPSISCIMDEELWSRAWSDLAEDDLILQFQKSRDVWLMLLLDQWLLRLLEQRGAADALCIGSNGGNISRSSIDITWLWVKTPYPRWPLKAF